MKYRVIILKPAEADLSDLYSSLLEKAGPDIATRYLGGILDFLNELSLFPMRGTQRKASVNGLRIVGYRRKVSIAFAVQDDKVLILGVFQKGRNITREFLETRT